MLRWIVPLGLMLAACAPAPDMAPEQARAVIEDFAAGRQEFDLCTDEGRAVLRGAVRVYSAAEARAGRMWPLIPEDTNDDFVFDSVNGSVLVAVAAGFVRVNDLHGEARRAARLLTLEHWFDVRDVRLATRLACPEMLRLQQTASRLVVETQRFERLSERRRRGGGVGALRQYRRVEALQREMNALAATIQARLDEHKAAQKR